MSEYPHFKPMSVGHKMDFVIYIMIILTKKKMNKRMNKNFTFCRQAKNIIKYFQQFLFVIKTLDIILIQNRLRYISKLQ